MKFILHAILIIIIISCGNTQEMKSLKHSNKYNDTLILVDSLNYVSTGNKQVLSNETAHKTLLEYFKSKKHYYPEEVMTLDSLLINDFNDNPQPMCIGFDTLYKVQLNNDNVLDGIITYWDMPCGASGTCYLPHKAIITKIRNKYYITNTDFIPDNYSIDSVKQDKEFAYIYGNEYDCANHAYIRSYRACIKRNN